MNPLKLKLLGDFGTWDREGLPVTVKARKNRGLLAALALAPSYTMPREYLAGLLWSDRGEAQSRSSLRQALVALRGALSPDGEAVFSVRGTKIALDPDRVEIDAVAFQELALSDDLDALRRAASLYQGDLLADTYIHDPVFEEWLSSERRRCADIAATVLEKLCALEAGPAQVNAAKRLVALDPLREAAHRTLMSIYYERGEKALALRQFAICQDLLRSELQVAPSEETRALHRRLQQDSAEIVSAGATRPPDGAPRPEAPPDSFDPPVVMVLPFENLTGDSTVANFCSGLGEDVVVGLSRISTIRVAARSAAGTRDAADIALVARDLGMRYVLEGSVRKRLDASRVTVQLIDAANGQHIWAQQINRNGADLTFDLQDEITRSIVGSVQTQIILSEGRSQTMDAGSDRVSRLLARSWRRLLGLTEESLAECRALSERALELEGRNGTAHRMRAVALYHQVYMGFIPWTQDTLDAIYAHAKLAIESDEADEYSHWAMECAHLLREEHELAAESLRRALEINPNCSLAIGSMGTVLAWSGQYDASVESNELALRANAQDPSNFFRHFGLALAHYLAGRYEKSVAHARMVVQARAGWWLAKMVYAAALAQSERPSEAARTLADVRPGGEALEISVLKALPFALASDREHLAEGLRKAGFGE